MGPEPEPVDAKVAIADHATSRQGAVACIEAAWPQCATCHLEHAPWDLDACASGCCDGSPLPEVRS